MYYVHYNIKFQNKFSCHLGGTTGNDPHFFMPLPNGDNLCYSVQGQADFMFSLIKDKYVQLNPQFVLPDSDESNIIANVSTFLHG